MRKVSYDLKNFRGGKIVELNKSDDLERLKSTREVLGGKKIRCKYNFKVVLKYISI